jgi:hypothetical protein
MNLDDLKDKLREALQSLKESSLWIQLSEKYHDLPPRGQTASLFGVGFLLALLLLLIPYSFFSSSQDQMLEVEDKKQLMRDLFQVTREVSALPPAPPTISVGEMRTQIQMELSNLGIQPEQFGPMMDFDNATTNSTSLPRNLQQPGVSINLTKLNLQQIVEVGQKLMAIRPTTKLVGLEVKAQTPDPHYFDVTYKIVALNLPPEPSSSTGAKSGARARPTRSGSGE